MRWYRIIVATGMVFGLVLGGGTGWAAEQDEARTRQAEAPTKEQFEVLARVGGRVITAEEFRLMFRRLGRGDIHTANAEKKREVLEQVIVQMLLLEEARQQGVDQRPVVRLQIEEAVGRVLIQNLLREKMVKVREVSEGDLLAYWKGHPEEFKGPPRVHLRQIFFAFKDPQSSADRDQTALKAAEAVKRAKQGESFEVLARRFSDDPATKDKGGDMGFLRPGQMAPYLEKAVTRLNPGEVSSPVAGPQGYHLVKLEAREQEGAVLPFEEVKEGLKQRLVRERQKAQIDEYVAELRRKTPVEINEQALKGK